MGGDRGREERKKRNNVFSSGGGGGTKGPAKIDKRNQELQCPHCERVFKQVQRYRDHLAKQHADVEAPAAETEEPEPSSSQVEKVMDVGSKGGRWTRKSPKLLLLEWTQAQKRPKPRYKALPEPDGTFRCKVVLPDEKDDKKDIVVFLDGSQAAGVEEDAQQAGALAALHSVAGDRAMHRILPQQYLASWEWHGEQAEMRKVREAGRQAAAEKRKEREKAQRAAEARRKPAAVIMSDSQRKMVESVLQDVRQDHSGSGPAEGEGLSAEEAARQLARLGFTERDSRMAISCAPPSDSLLLPSLLDWLCVHLPEEHLPASFAPAASAKPVSLVKPLTPEEARLVPDSAVADLASCGYRPEEVAAALQGCGGDCEAAFVQLYSRLTGLEETPSVDAPLKGGVGVSEEWEEELQAMEAIYDGDATQVHPGHLRLALAEGRMALDLRHPTQAAYPSAPPLIALRSSGHPAWALLQATKELATLATSLVGSPMCHDLALAAPDILRDCLAAPSYACHAHSHPRQQEGQGTHQSEERRDEIGAEPANGKGTKALGDGRDSRRKPRRDEIDVLQESKRLQAASSKEPSQKLYSLQEARRKLPAYKQKAEVVTALQQHHVVVVSGATGCGKSTQVPQYILEDAIARGVGGACNILCTQPRRISALGLANRVSQERGESTGDVVGYSVRFDSRRSARTRLLFCTTGILLRRLLSDAELEGVTHVIVDEVHERSVDSDLLLLLLKDLLQRKGTAAPRIVLMSATADAELFAAYFSSTKHTVLSKAGLLTIPGFTHPVEDFFLEDALEMTGYKIGPSSRYASKKAVTKSNAKARKESKATKDKDQPSISPPPADGTEMESWDTDGAESPAPRGWSAQPVPDDDLQQYSEQTRRSLAVVDESILNYELVEALICHVIGQGRSTGLLPNSGSARAILVFMPGAPEISRLVRSLQSSKALQRASNGQQLRVLPLHGALPPAQQARVFERVPEGVQKIVVSTNVAETSVTIDDIVCVIDTGRVKEIRYDAGKGLSRLEECWCSTAAAAQRRGRAGRVQPGVCIKLFSRKQASKLERHQAPEVLRVPLHQLSLTVKATLPGGPPIADTLARLLSPPPPPAVGGAVDDLKRMGTLTSTGEVLTPLGRHLCRMPVDAKLGKALIYAAMLRCLSPMLTIVAAMGYGRPIFLSPPDKRAEANAAKQRLTRESAAAKSDHLTLIAAFNSWNTARLKGGRAEASRVASELFLSEAAMEGILAGRSDYAAALVDLGFIGHSYCRGINDGDVEAWAGVGGVDEHSGNARIVKAALCAGFYPSLLRVELPAEVYAKTHGGAMPKDAPPIKLRFFDRVKGRVFIHPASVHFDVGRYECPWLIYTDLTETTKVFCREASAVPVYSLLLFGGELTVDHEKSLVKLDSWATFKAPARVAVLVKQMRAEVDKLLLLKIEDPSLDLSQSKVIDALHGLLATDGF